MEIKKSYCSPISVFLIIAVMALVAPATGRQSSAFEFDPDYPVGTPPVLGGTGYVTEDKDDDGWYNAIDWGEQYTEKDSTGLYGKYHAGEDWNDEDGGSSDVDAPVYAIAGGTVIAIKDEIYANHNYGSGIVIEHTLPNDEKIYSVYVHIDITSGLSEGDFVGQGDRIGTIAAISPLSPHLHFEIRTKWVEQGQDWWPNDYMNTGYYASKEDIIADGLVEPSGFIDSHRYFGPVEQNQPIPVTSSVTLTLYVHDGDKNGPVIPDAIVHVCSDGNMSHKETTNSLGYIEWTGEQGTWSFGASADGYETKYWDQEITEDCTKHAFLKQEQQQEPAENSVVGKWNAEADIDCDGDLLDCEEAESNQEDTTRCVDEFIFNADGTMEGEGDLSDYTWEQYGNTIHFQHNPESENLGTKENWKCWFTYDGTIKGNTMEGTFICKWFDSPDMTGCWSAVRAGTR